MINWGIHVTEQTDGNKKVEPPKATPQPKQPTRNNPPKKDNDKGSWFVATLKFVVKLVIIIIIAGAGYAAYLSYQNYTQVSAQLNEQAAAMQTLENQINSTLPALRKDMATTLKQNQDSLAELRVYVTDTALRLTESQGITRYEWLLAEAEYLMRLAQQRLVLERDATGALSILQSADRVLSDANDTNLITVRQQLAREMAALAAVSELDREGLYLQINLMIESIESWSPAAALAEQKPDITLDNPTPSWTDRFSQFIRISRVDAMDRAPIQPHLIPLYRALLQNALSQAQTAVLRQQPDTYRAAVLSARTFYDRYGASPGSPSQLGQQLETLSNVTLDSELPRLGGALTLLKEYIATVYQLQRTAPEER